MRSAVKSVLRRSLIPLLAAERVRHAASSFMRDRTTIFMIHGVAQSPDVRGLSVTSLAAMLEELRARKLKVVSLQSVIERYIAGEPQLPDSVAFTLDDGTSEQMDLIIPVLASYDCLATVFVITGFIDKQVWPWDYKIDYILANTACDRIIHSLGGLRNPLERTVRYFDRDALQNYCKQLHTEEVANIVAEISAAAEVDLPDAIPVGWEPLTWDRARALEKRGIQFAPHGVSHAILSKLTPISSEAEIRESWRRVKEELVAPCPVFAWPTGRLQDFGTREIDYAKNVGLIGAVTASCDYAVLPPGGPVGDTQYRVGRFAMPDNVLDFLQYSTWIEHAKQRLSPRGRSQVSKVSREYA